MNISTVRHSAWHRGPGCDTASPVDSPESARGAHSGGSAIVCQTWLINGWFMVNGGSMVVAQRWWSQWWLLMVGWWFLLVVVNDGSLSCKKWGKWPLWVQPVGRGSSLVDAAYRDYHGRPSCKPGATSYAGCDFGSFGFTNLELGVPDGVIYFIFYYLSLYIILFSLSLLMCFWLLKAVAGSWQRSCSISAAETFQRTAPRWWFMIYNC